MVDILNQVSPTISGGNLMKVSVRSRVDKQGRLLIPAELRRELGIVAGEPVTMRIADDNTLRVITVREAIRQLQEWAAQFKKPGESVVDEFIREKREEAARE